MLAFRIALARLRALFRRDSTTDEIREELDFHVAMRADEYARRGPRCGRGTPGGTAPLRQCRGDSGPRLRRQRRRRDGDDPSGREVLAAPAGPSAVLLHPGRADARARHRRVHRALQRHRRGAAAAAPLSAPRAARHHRRRRNQPDRQDVPFRAVDGGHSHLANAPGDRRPGRDGTGQQRIYAADRGHRHARPDDRRRSVGRLSRDLRHLPHPRPWHPRGRHSRRRSSRRPAGARLLAERIRRRSKRARPRHPDPGPPGHDRRRAPGRLLQGDGALEGQAVQRGDDRSPRHGHSRDRAAAGGRLAGAGERRLSKRSRRPRRWSDRRHIRCASSSTRCTRTRPASSARPSTRCRWRLVSS